MQTLTYKVAAWAVVGSTISAMLLSTGCAGAGASYSRSAVVPPTASAPQAAPADWRSVSIVSDRKSVARPPYAFSAGDEALLDTIQRGCFNYFWLAVDPVSGMVPDRSSVPFASTAGVGFQLSAFVIGAERGWVTRAQAAERAERILTTLMSRNDNHTFGIFQHFVDGATAAPHKDSPEHVASTIDSALLFAGVLTASSYFGGRVAEIGDAMFARADWSKFVATPINSPQAKPHELGFISLGWKPNEPLAVGKSGPGSGSLLPYYWIDSGCEHRLVAFLAACAPDDAKRADPEMYYRLRRGLGFDPASGPVVFFPFSGALFTNTFSHCWIDYAHMAPDSPAKRSHAARVDVDWWENSRRMVKFHQASIRRDPATLAKFNVNAWGLGASDCPEGYCVPGLYPSVLPMTGARPEFDYSTYRATNDLGDGTIAPYAPGSAIMFDPAEAIASMRYFKSLTKRDGTPLMWREPAAAGAAIASGTKASPAGGYGFLDAVNLTKLDAKSGEPWVAHDYVAIDQGPLLLAIENARSGLLWKVFHEHRFVKMGSSRLGMVREVVP